MVEQDSAQRRRELKSKVRRYALVAALIALVLAVWGIVSRILARSELRKRTTRERRAHGGDGETPAERCRDELVLPGIVQAYIESPIYARTNGYLKVWYTDIGARVHKGQLLAEIETPEVDRELAQAQADLDTAQANFALSKITNERWQGLLQTQSVSKQDADEKAGDAAAKAAMVESARQNVKRLSDLESFKRVLAPFDGVVTARNTDVGYLINAGQAPGTELFRVADIHKLRIYAQVPEAYAAATETGLKAQLHFAERPGKSYEAETVRTSNALDPTARTLQVELQLDNTRIAAVPRLVRRDSLQAAVEHRDPADSGQYRVVPRRRLAGRRGPESGHHQDQEGQSRARFRQDRRDTDGTRSAGRGRGQSAGFHQRRHARAHRTSATEKRRRSGQRARRPVIAAPACAHERSSRPWCALAGGCSFAPPYKVPDTGTAPEHYKELADWKVAEPKDAQPRGNWWVVYDDPGARSAGGQNSARI